MTTLVHRHPEQYLHKSRFTRYLQYFRDGGLTFYSVFTVLKPTHRRTQHTRVNLFEQRLPHKTQNSLAICVLPKYTEISTPPQRQLRFSKFRGTVNMVAGYICTRIPTYANHACRMHVHTHTNTHMYTAHVPTHIHIPVHP